MAVENVDHEKFELLLVPVDGFIDEGDSTEETYRLALESVLRWTWHTADQDPMDVVRSIRKVATTALRSV